jgi:hypothetical protein
MANQIQPCKILDFKFPISKLNLSNSKSLEEIVLIAENLVEAEGYLARANFKLSQLYGEKGNQKLQKDYMAAAEVIRKRLSGDALLTDDVLEEAYNRLVPWMLW